MKTRQNLRTYNKEHDWLINLFSGTNQRSEYNSITVTSRNTSCPPLEKLTQRAGYVFDVKLNPSSYFGVFNLTAREAFSISRLYTPQVVLGWQLLHQWTWKFYKGRQQRWETSMIIIVAVAVAIVAVLLAVGLVSCCGCDWLVVVVVVVVLFLLPLLLLLWLLLPLLLLLSSSSSSLLLLLMHDHYFASVFLGTSKSGFYEESERTAFFPHASLERGESP